MNRHSWIKLSSVSFVLSAAFGACTEALESPDPDGAEQASPLGQPSLLAPNCTSSGVNCGLTWVKRYHTNTTGQDTLSCHDYTSGMTTPTSCNAYMGDTDCKQVRRILCIRKDGSASNGFVGSFYNGWAAGNIGLTHGIQGSTLTSLAVANAACVAEFGVGWRMGEHSDGGGGWGWTAYGNLNDIFTANHLSHTLDDRFWVHINNQPGAPGVLDGGNCWD
jgi:hypothetical protein